MISVHDNKVDFVSICGCVGVGLAVNGEAGEGRNMSNDCIVHLIDIRSDVFYCVLFDLRTNIFVTLNCSVVLFWVKIE